jgi:hypothetical protein
MVIQKLFMKFIQCDYNIYNIEVLIFFHFSQLYLFTWPITNSKILQKLPKFYGQCSVFSPYKHGQVNKKSSPLHYNFEVFHEINVKIGNNEKNS